ELPVRGGDGVATLGGGDCDDDGVAEACDGIGPDVEHAVPWALVDELHAGEGGSASRSTASAAPGKSVTVPSGVELSPTRSPGSPRRSRSAAAPAARRRMSRSRFRAITWRRWPP